MTMPLRFWLFLYSGRNLAGSLLALGGLGLFFAGVIEHWWLAIVAGLYGTGWLAVPAQRRQEEQLRNETNLIDSVGRLIGQDAAGLPAEATASLNAIYDIITALAPRLTDGSMGMEQTAALTNAVTRDLPETVGSYRRLPAAFASLHVLEDGKTCRQLLIDQLSLLTAQLRKIADDVYRDDADALLANGRFLREKFHTLSSS